MTLGRRHRDPARRDARARAADLVARARRACASSYPGVWLVGPRLGDARALPRSPPAARGRLRRRPRAARPPAARRRRRRPTTSAPAARRRRALEALLTRWLPRPLAELTDELAELLRAATMPGSPRRALGRRLAPLAERTLGAQMRRASIPALARVVHRLGVERRLGRLRPRPSLRAARRRRPAPVARPGGVAADRQHRLVGLRAAAPAPRQRRRTRTGPGARSGWPTGGEPEAIGLLDHLDAATLHGRPRRAEVSRRARARPCRSRGARR